MTDEEATGAPGTLQESAGGRTSPRFSGDATGGAGPTSLPGPTQFTGVYSYSSTQS